MTFLELAKKRQTEEETILFILQQAHATGIEEGDFCREHAS